MNERRSIHVDEGNVDAEDPTQRQTAPGNHPLVGRLLAGKYLVRELIGKGAMGAVYRARQVALDKRVAIKVMNPALGVDGNFAQRFKREAKAASRLEHPNSVHILDFGQEPDGTLYMAMEYLEGVDLGQLIERSDFLPDQFIVDVVAQALSALSRAHELGIIHRDLKPENIMILDAEDDEGRRVVKVCDFGIAKLAPGARGSKTSGSQAPAATSSTRPPRVGATTLNGDLQDETAVTKVGHVLGTPEYMSPEQGRGQTLDLRTDIYSMGVILYQMLTKALPFDAETPLGIVAKHVIETPRAPSAIRPDVNRRLEAVAMRAMQKSPEARYATAREMRTDLRAATGMPDASGASGRWSSKALVGDVKSDLVEGSAQGVASSRDLRPASPNALSHASTQLVLASPPKEFAPVGAGAARTSGRTRTAVIAVAGVAVISLALLAFGRHSRDARDDAAPTTGASAPPVAVPIGVPSATASARAATAKVSISASPPEAKIFVDDAPLANPGTVTVPRDGKEHPIRIEAAGYVSATRSFTANNSESSLSFDLEHATAAATATTAAPSATTPKHEAPVAPAPQPAPDPSP